MVEAQIIEEVLRRLEVSGPRALLIGRRPADPLGYSFTSHAPYDAVLIGSLTAEQLLSFSDNRVLEALLTGMPVYLYEGGLTYRRHSATASRALWGRLTAAERTLRQWGVRFYGGKTGGSGGHTVVTAARARQLLARGLQPPAGAVLTPMARELLEGGGLS